MNYSSTIDHETDICQSISRRLIDTGIWPDGTDRTHLISPEPFFLSAEQEADLHRLGKSIHAFYQAANKLYLHKGNDWAKEYLDIGKNEDVLKLGRMNFHKQATPLVIRPDIMLTDDGFVITELDSVPGGIGHLDCLSSVYQECGFKLTGTGIHSAFAAMLEDSAGKHDPVIAIIVSDESEDYRPEMTALAKVLRNNGLNIHCIHPRQIHFTEEALMVENESEKIPVDMIYRFYELFDLPNIPKSELLIYAAKKRLAAFVPCMKHFLEEKMLLALLHNETLKEFWLQTMGEEDYYRMLTATSPTWIMDSRPIPPHAHISGFEWGGKSIRDWKTIASGTQKQRSLVLKPSGFSPLAWGSRGVKIGSDMPQSEWEEAVERSISDFDNRPWVLQPFREGKIHEVEYMDRTTDDIKLMHGRVRLCPYYFVYEQEAHLAGVMATVCPRDKKIIHGMADAVIMPCAVK